MTAATEFARGDRVTVAGWRGIAFYIERHETERQYPDPEWLCHEHFTETDGCDDGCEGYWPEIDPDDYEDVPTGNLVVVMVGDDREWSVDPEDCAAVDDDAYCHECGQLGCRADGRSRLNGGGS